MALRTRSRMSSDTYPLPFTTSETDPGLLRHIAHADHDRTFPVITVLSLYVHVLTTKYYIHLHSLEPVRQSGVYIA